MVFTSAVAIIALTLYANSIGHGYVLDDTSVLKENALTTSGVSAIPAIFTTSYRAGYSSTIADGLYRPLPIAVFATEWQLAPDSAHVYHAINVLLYAIAAALLFLTLTRLLGDSLDTVAFVATILWVTHPVHTEVVANIKSLDEILAFLLSTGALFVALDYVRRPRGWTLALSACLYGLALLSKENAIAAVAIVPIALVYVARAPRRDAIRLVAVWGVVTIAYLVVRALVLGGSAWGPSTVDILDNPLAQLPGPLARLPTAIDVLGHYARLLVVPYPLLYDHSYGALPTVGWTDPRFIVSGLAYLTIGVAAVVALLRGLGPRIFWFGAICYLISILPASNLVTLIGAGMAERFLFAPSLGFCLALAGLTQVKWGRTAAPRWAVSCLMALATAWSVEVVTRNRVWADDLTLFSTDVQTSPQSARIQYDLGLALVRDEYPRQAGDAHRGSPVLLEATSHLRSAIQIAPDYADAYNELGVAYQHLQQYDQALTAFERAVALDRDNPRFLNNLGVCDLALARYPEAVTALARALQIAPRDGNAWLNLGTAYGSSGDFENSIKALLEAAALQPSNPVVYRNLAVTYRRMGRIDEADRYQARADALRR